MNKREYAAEQAIASACIEGFVPDPVSMADWDKLVKEEITSEEFRRRVFARAVEDNEVMLRNVA
jgi:hypothetical protein